MATDLSDLLAAMNSAVSSANVKGQVAAIEIARMYQAHPILKHLPPPVARLESVEL